MATRLEASRRHVPYVRGAPDDRGKGVFPGRKPIPTKNKIAAMMIPPATAPAKIDRKRHGAESFTSSSMRSSVFTGATPIENGQRFQRTMQRDANGTLCHLEPVGCLADAAAIERYGSDDFPLLRLQVP